MSILWSRPPLCIALRRFGITCVLLGSGASSSGIQALQSTLTPGALTVDLVVAVQDRCGRDRRYFGVVFLEPLRT